MQAPKLNRLRVCVCVRACFKLNTPLGTALINAYRRTRELVSGDPYMVEGILAQVRAGGVGGEEGWRGQAGHRVSGGPYMAEGILAQVRGHSGHDWGKFKLSGRAAGVPWAHRALRDAS